MTRRFSGLSIRLLAFNVLLVFLPVFGILSLESYELHLLEAQERAMVQLGRVLAASLGEGDGLDAEQAQQILVNLRQEQEFRLRVIDSQGKVIADSSRLGPRQDGVAGDDKASKDSLTEPIERTQPLYQVGLFFYRIATWLNPPPDPPVPYGPHLGTGDTLTGREVAVALAGRYGSATRRSAGSRSLTMYSALPISSGDQVVGAVVVSRSTYRILQSLWDFRIRTVRVVLIAAAAAAVLSLLVSTTIARPLRRLRRDAQALLDRRGRLRRRFPVLRRRDEIGDLSRALAELTSRLENHQAFLESFASDVSHEFKNPLASIRTATELLAEIEAPEERQHFTTMVLHDVARLEKLLVAVRDITQIDAALEAQSVEAVPLGPLLNSLIDQRSLRHVDPGRFVLHAAQGPLLVNAAPPRLDQVFDNLLANAESFAPPDTAIDLTVDAVTLIDATGLTGNAVRVRVRDRGPGIDPHNRDRIFQRFFSYRPETTKGDNGHTGLGLAIVKAIVEGYGGTVTADDASGGGAVFTVTLPAA